MPQTADSFDFFTAGADLIRQLIGTEHLTRQSIAQPDSFAGLARDSRVAFAILACEAPIDTLRERIDERLRRGDDASEADTDVLQKLSALAEPPGPDESARVLRINSSDSGKIEDAIRSWSDAAPSDAT